MGEALQVDRWEYKLGDLVMWRPEESYIQNEVVDCKGRFYKVKSGFWLHEDQIKQPGPGMD